MTNLEKALIVAVVTLSIIAFVLGEASRSAHNEIDELETKIVQLETKLERKSRSKSSEVLDKFSAIFERIVKMGIEAEKEKAK